MSESPEVQRVRLYQDERGEWRWAALAGNGLTVADSGEGYEHWGDCRDAAASLFPDAELVEG